MSFRFREIVIRREGGRRGAERERVGGRREKERELGGRPHVMAARGLSNAEHEDH